MATAALANAGVLFPHALLQEIKNKKSKETLEIELKLIFFCLFSFDAR